MKDWKLVLAGGGIALAGMVVGASLFGASEARAQRTYTQCFFGYQEAVDINDSGVVASPGANRMIAVPSGYEVVGGGAGSMSVGAILFCR